MPKQSPFLAWIFRMPLIKRWGLMHCIKPENVAEHSHQVSVIAHLLVVIKNTRYGGNLNPDRAASLAMFHEVSETRLMDTPSPVKYQNPELTKQFKKLEMLAEQECLDTLPEDLQPAYANLIIQNEVDPAYKPLLKAADIIAAYIKALDELKYGNREFETVKAKLGSRLDEYRETMPEVGDCLDIFAEKCLATLDELVVLSDN